MEKIRKIRKKINSYGLDGYLIPKNDEFFNEYVSNEDDNLKYISNFSGSYGLALILKKKNYLFIDGRYTIQAKNQSSKYYNIVKIPNRLPKNIIKNKKLKIGFDPKLHNKDNLTFLFKKTKCLMVPLKENLVDSLKKRKKEKKIKKFFIINDNHIGQSRKLKIKRLSKMLDEDKIDLLFITASENIAWLLNLRGEDSEFSPLPNGYLLFSKKEIIFYCDSRKIDKLTKKKLSNVKIIDIKFIEEFLSKIHNYKVQIDSLSCSFLFQSILEKNNFLIKKRDPIYLLKSVKNKIEIRNTIKSHIYDGVALTKFILWIKNNFKKNKITELSAEKKLMNLRKKNKFFKFPSFSTIAASGPNAAIIHYKANTKSNRSLKKGELFLVDSGGQYNFGTTDVTRTISLDNNDKRIKNIFTRVLKSHIAVASYKLKKNSTGSDIDYQARRPLKQINLDYAHGTGHGVGYFLNVHEGPQAISKNNFIKLKEGMILSNEPGYYEPNNFGIRIENLISIKKSKKTLSFFNLTMAPIEKTLIEKKLLNKKEIFWLNNYHQVVFKNIKKYMNVSEFKQLKILCSNI